MPSSDHTPPSKQLKVNHVHQPRGVFTLNAANYRVGTEAEYQRVYQNDFQALDFPQSLPASLRTLDNPQMAEVRDMPGETQREPFEGIKRDHATFLQEDGEEYDHSLLSFADGAEMVEETFVYPQTSADLTAEDAFGMADETFAVLPVVKADKDAEWNLVNPFAEYAVSRHPKLKDSDVRDKRKGAVDGYLKFRFNIAEPGKNVFQELAAGMFGQTNFGIHHQVPVFDKTIPHLPRGFDTPQLDLMDQHLLRFYLTAFCRGRTLLSKTNLWCHDIAPIAAKNSCVKHAMLALSAGYWLHFNPNETVLNRANEHYRKAAELLSEEMLNPDHTKVGKDDAVVAAMLLFFIDDAVNFELRRDKNQESRWSVGARTARWILTQADPGQRYWKSVNVQCGTARISNANYVAFVEILALLVTPLRAEGSDQMYSWLLQGTEEESRQVHGGTGMCPKLLHIFSQITTLCGRMAQQPASLILPHGGHALLEMLTNFRQKSDLSDGYPTTEALLRSCSLDKGKVSDKAKVTELTAEAWVATAKIYLQCRFFRLPRTHPDVQVHLNILLKCIGWMPCTGHLFTSQSPFGCVFILCMVATSESDRRVGREWFEVVTSDSSNRSSVPPVWKAVQRMWEWFDNEYIEAEFDEDSPIGERHAWWEDAVEHLIETDGEIPLY
ncbi:hypothetical protein LTS15_006663 [Exophiala xenobiotica]|nr:hypothetical protein LTS15_006663 [Exophiala xenobiotica]